jgi:hypothetical protein
VWHGGDEKYTQHFLENLKRRDHSEDLWFDWRIMLKEMGWEGVDWTHLAQDRNR